MIKKIILILIIGSRQNVCATTPKMWDTKQSIIMITLLNTSFVLIMEQMGLFQNEKKEGCYDIGLEWKLHPESINMYCDYDILYKSILIWVSKKDNVLVPLEWNPAALQGEEAGLFSGGF